MPIYIKVQPAKHPKVRIETGNQSEEEKMQCLQWNHSANNQKFLIRNHGNQRQWNNIFKELKFFKKLLMQNSMPSEKYLEMKVKKGDFKIKANQTFQQQISL